MLPHVLQHIAMLNKLFFDQLFLVTSATLQFTDGLITMRSSSGTTKSMMDSSLVITLGLTRFVFETY